MARKALGISEDLHKRINQIAADEKLPMTVVLESLLDQSGQVNWDSVRASHERIKPTWANIRRVVEEYQVKFPQATDQKLSELSGYSIKQVETVTHSAHKRCIEMMKRGPRFQPKRIAEDCNVSPKFAERIYEQFHKGAKIPKNEEYLFVGLRA